MAAAAHEVMKVPQSVTNQSGPVSPAAAKHSGTLSVCVCVCVPGGLADREDERGQFHSVVDAWRHASEREGVHHEGVQIRS